MTSKERERFISENIKLVSYAVNPFVPLGKSVGLDFDDLFSIGCIGLIKAVDYFDVSRGVQFSTYAVPMIRGYVQQNLREHGSPLKFSRRYKEAWWTIKRHGLDDATAEEIQQQLQMDKETVEGAFAYGDRSRLYSLDRSTEASDGKDDVTLHDFLGVNDDFSNVVVDDFSSRLDEREKRVVRGILAGKSQDEIGKELGVSQPIVSKLRNRIAGKLKDYLDGKDTEVVRRGKGDTEEAKRLLTTTKLTYKEISERTGVPLGTVSVYGSRLRKKDKELELAM